MNFDELKTIAKKRKTYSIIETVSIIFMIIMAFIMCGLMLTKWQGNKVFFSIIVVFSFSLVITYFVSLIMARKYYFKGEEYIISKIKELVECYGIVPKNYTVVSTIENRYMISFHNQIVDYDELEGKISTELSTMNSILNSKIHIGLL